MENGGEECQRGGGTKKKSLDHRSDRVRIKRQLLEALYRREGVVGKLGGGYTKYGNYGGGGSTSISSHLDHTTLAGPDDG